MPVYLKTAEDFQKLCNYRIIKGFIGYLSALPYSGWYDVYCPN